jgi:ribonuclease HI
MNAMELANYILSFSWIDEEQASFMVQDDRKKISVRYNRLNGHFSFDDHNELSETILENQFQLKKIIHSALKGKQPDGRTIQFSFIKDFPFMRNNDFYCYIQVDRRYNDFDIQVKKDETKNIHKLFTDGSYAHDREQSGYAGIIEDPGGNRQIFHASSTVKSSNLIELLAISEGLERLMHVDKIQVNTDSRFVIRGLAQWIYFWKLNNWHTAQGTGVKFVRHWQRLDRLCEGKFLELKWIKAHSGNSNHTLCHQMAKSIATAKH